MDYETLRYEQDGHVVTLTYDRPEQHNAVNRTMNRELHHAWQRFRDDDSAFVLSMFMRRDRHTLGASAFKAGDLEPEWPHHGL
jgi:1,4-dihydroxy-2-naphthoyl-CoA synthase